MPNKQEKIYAEKILNALYDSGFVIDHQMTFSFGIGPSWQDQINIICNILDFKDGDQFKKLESGTYCGIFEKECEKERTCKDYDNKTCNCFLPNVTKENWICIKNKTYYSRVSTEYSKWRISVMERDGYICQDCGSKSSLCVHHIKSFDDYPELRDDISNGLTLCVKCHRKIHIREVHDLEDR